MIFIINNQEFFQTNSSIHNINTRNKCHLHKPKAKLQADPPISAGNMFQDLPWLRETTDNAECCV